MEVRSEPTNKGIVRLFTQVGGHVRRRPTARTAGFSVTQWIYSVNSSEVILSPPNDDNIAVHRPST